MNIDKEFIFIEENQSGPQIVLFTGGRDSTLTASILMMRGIPVCQGCSKIKSCYKCISYVRSMDYLIS